MASTEAAPPADLAAPVRPHRAMAAAPPIVHPYPAQRLARHDPRQEPGVLVPHAGLCAGGLGNRHPYRDHLIR
jgi:hypothetical protein